MHSATGRRGISWYKNKEKWVAYIYYEKKYYYLGTYNDIDSAISARIEAENAKKTENDFAGWYEHWIEDYKRSRKMKGGKMMDYKNLTKEQRSELMDLAEAAMRSDVGSPERQKLSELTGQPTETIGDINKIMSDVINGMSKGEQASDYWRTMQRLNSTSQ